jgi:flagellar assembly factor FliW
MSKLHTKYFGEIERGDESAFHFALGLPAFEGEKSFVPIELPGGEPLVFLQSTATPELCFLAFPIQVVDPEYCLALAAEDLAVLGLDGERQPRIGKDVLALAFLSVRDGFPVTANLMAPLVVNLRTFQAVQAVRHDSRYSFEHLVQGAGAVQPC